VIFLKGSTGTLTELAFAAAVKRPVFFLGSKEFLYDKARTLGLGKLSQGDEKLKLRDFLERASAVYAAVTERHLNVSELESSLERALTEVEEFSEGKEESLIERVLTHTSKSADFGETNFPGLPENPRQARRLFDDVIRTLDS
jgi:hypothetical protein